METTYDKNNETKLRAEAVILEKHGQKKSLWEVTKKFFWDYVGNESENEVRDKKHSRWEKW